MIHMQIMTPLFLRRASLALELLCSWWMLLRCNDTVFRNRFNSVKRRMASREISSSQLLERRREWTFALSMQLRSWLSWWSCRPVPMNLMTSMDFQSNLSRKAFRLTSFRSVWKSSMVLPLTLVLQKASSVRTASILLMYLFFSFSQLMIGRCRTSTSLSHFLCQNSCYLRKLTQSFLSESSRSSSQMGSQSGLQTSCSWSLLLLRLLMRSSNLSLDLFSRQLGTTQLLKRHLLCSKSRMVVSLPFQKVVSLVFSLLWPFRQTSTRDWLLGERLSQSLKLLSCLHSSALMDCLMGESTVFTKFMYTFSLSLWRWLDWSDFLVRQIIGFMDDLSVFLSCFLMRLWMLNCRCRQIAGSAITIWAISYKFRSANSRTFSSTTLLYSSIEKESLVVSSWLFQEEKAWLASFSYRITLFLRESILLIQLLQICSNSSVNARKSSYLSLSSLSSSSLFSWKVLLVSDCAVFFSSLSSACWMCRLTVTFAKDCEARWCGQTTAALAFFWAEERQCAQMECEQGRLKGML